jgi:hypothetical protein
MVTPFAESLVDPFVDVRNAPSRLGELAGRGALRSADAASVGLGIDERGVELRNAMSTIAASEAAAASVNAPMASRRRRGACQIAFPSTPPEARRCHARSSEPPCGRRR